MGCHHLSDHCFSIFHGKVVTKLIVNAIDSFLSLPLEVLELLRVEFTFRMSTLAASTSICSSLNGAFNFGVTFLAIRKIILRVFFNAYSYRLCAQNLGNFGVTPCLFLSKRNINL